MFSLFVAVCFSVAAVNAGFHQKFNHHRHHFTYDMNGFKGHHSEMSGMFGAPDRHYGSPPPPVYGPPPPFPHPHHHHHHMDSPNFPGFPDHGPGCQQNHGGGNFGFSNMMPFNPFLEPSANMPQIPFNMPNFNSPNPFGGYMPTIMRPNTNEYDVPNSPSNIPLNTPSNLPVDALPTSPSTFDVNSPIPLDANTAFGDSNNVQSSTIPNTNSYVAPFNADNQPQNGILVNPPNGFEGNIQFHCY